MRKEKSRQLRMKQEKLTESAQVPAAASPRSKMEALALEYDLLCQAEDDIRDRGGKPDRHFINTIDRRLPAIEGLLSTSEPQNINDLHIFAVMLRSKLGVLRDSAGSLIYPERYGNGKKVFTLEDYQKIAPDLRSDIADLQAMISIMIDGMERVSGTTAERLGIGRLASCLDGSENDY
jgi:hypothetical protein